MPMADSCQQSLHFNYRIMPMLVLYIVTCLNNFKIQFGKHFRSSWSTVSYHTLNHCYSCTW